MVCNTASQNAAVTTKANVEITTAAVVSFSKVS